jgi:hypothetical protein
MRIAMCALAVVCGACGRPSAIETEGAKARMSAAEAAAGLAIEGATAAEARFPEMVHGQRARHGPRVSHAMVWLRAFDWSGVDLAGFPGGPAGALLAQAEMHERALASVGLVPLRGLGTNPGRPRGPYRHGVHVRCRHEGGGGGGYMLDLDAPRLAHYRVYRGSRSGAVLFARLEYDQASRRLEVEFAYADTTILGERYPEARASLEETVDVE